MGAGDLLGVQPNILPRRLGGQSVVLSVVLANKDIRPVAGNKMHGLGGGNFGLLLPGSPGFKIAHLPQFLRQLRQLPIFRAFPQVVQLAFQISQLLQGLRLPGQGRFPGCLGLLVFTIIPLGVLAGAMLGIQRDRHRRWRVQIVIQHRRLLGSRGDPMQVCGEQFPIQPQPLHLRLAPDGRLVYGQLPLAALDVVEQRAPDAGPMALHPPLGVLALV